MVSRVRRILGTRRVGHTGTLDPFATGVLPIAVNDGTKAIPFLDEGVKQYDAELQLGIVTDSHDLTGNILRASEDPDVPRERFESVLQRFMGITSQIPPMYSAVKQAGMPLYRLARQGIEVERQPRSITVDRLEILHYAPPFVSLRVSCSRGTYIRVLAHDIGEELGCGASLRGLRRLTSGPFHISRALSLAELEETVSSGLLEKACISPSSALRHLPEITLTDSGRMKVMHGQSLSWDEAESGDPSLCSEGGFVRLSREGKLLAVAVLGKNEQSEPRLKPKRVFV